MAIFLAIVGLLTKVLDFLNPWSSYWAGKSKDKDVARAKALKDMADAAAKGDFDAFDRARADKHSIR